MMMMMMMMMIYCCRPNNLIQRYRMQSYNKNYYKLVKNRALLITTTLHSDTFRDIKETTIDLISRHQHTNHTSTSSVTKIAGMIIS